MTPHSNIPPTRFHGPRKLNPKRNPLLSSVFSTDHRIIGIE
jgi:hypothetical protein